MTKRQGPSPLYYEVSSKNVPTLRVRPGEVFEVVTQMNRAPDQTAVPPPVRADWSAFHSDTVERGNPSSGAIWVEGARPGDVVELIVDTIELAPVGWIGYSGDNPVFPALLGESSIPASTTVVRIENQEVVWPTGQRLPARPMIGLVAVAPAYESQSTIRVGPWGGNLDVQEITEGAKVLLPVSTTGALLHIGDVHALQGDGEVAGCGVETAGILRLRVQITDRPEGMTWPRIVTPTHLLAIGADRPAESAFRIAVVELIKWLSFDYGIDPSEALLFLGQVLTARATQLVNPTVTYVAGIERQLLGELSRT